MRLYIDPGTGSMLFSLVIGLISVIWFGARKLLLKLKYLTPGQTKTVSAKKDIVIYSEDKRYWTTFKGILDEFERRKIPVTYLAGSEDDPNLAEPYEFVQKEVIGLGNKAFAKLNFLNARIVLATTPGLDVYQWKRSKDVDWYVHLTHMIGGGFDYRMFGVQFFDALLYSSDAFTPAHRELEQKRGSAPKDIVAVGCTYLDRILERYHEENELPQHEKIRVLVAPSWGPNSLFNQFGDRILKQLISSDFDITVRPHPQSYLVEQELLQSLQASFPESDRLHWNRDPDNFDVLSHSDVMISDFSGVIFDFSFVFERPVIYPHIEFDMGMNDQVWIKEPFWCEEALPLIGSELRMDELNRLNALIETLVQQSGNREKLRQARERYWQNRGRAAEAVVDYLVSKCEALKQADASGRERA